MSNQTLTPNAGALAIPGTTSTTNWKVVPGVGRLFITGSKSPGPIAGALAIAGIAGSMNLGLSPGTGSLGLTGYAPLALSPITTLVPGAGALNMRTAGQTTLVPGAGTLRMTTPGQTLAFTPNTGTLTATGQQVTQTYTLPTPANGVLALTGIAPTLSFNLGFIIPNAGALAIQGAAPLLKIATTPAAGALALTGFAPTLFQTNGIVPATGALNLAGQASALKYLLNTKTGALTLTGNVSQVTTGSFRVPPTAAINFSGALISSLGLGLKPGTGSAAFTGFAGSLSYSFNLKPGTGTLTLTGQLPVLNGSFVEGPGTGALAFGSTPPIINLSYTLKPATGTLLITGQPAGIIGPIHLVPNTGTLRILGNFPSLNGGLSFQPRAGAITFGSAAGSMGFNILGQPGSLTLVAAPVTLIQTVTIQITPNPGALNLTGFASSIAGQGRIFKSATFIAVSATGIQAARSVYIAGTLCVLEATYFNTLDEPFIPQQVQYRIDDVLSGANIVPWTTVPPGTSNNINVTSAQNEMISNSRPWEVHQAMLQILDGAGNTNYVTTLFDILRVASA